MNFAVLDDYFNVASAPDSDSSNQSYGYRAPVVANEATFIHTVLSTKNKAHIASLKSESDRTRKQLRRLFKLRASKKNDISKELSKSYQHMLLRQAELIRRYGQSQLAIINWRIIFEQKYLSELKSVNSYFGDISLHIPKIPELSQEPSQSFEDDNEHKNVEFPPLPPSAGNNNTNNNESVNDNNEEIKLETSLDDESKIEYKHSTIDLKDVHGAGANNGTIKMDEMTPFYSGDRTAIHSLNSMNGNRRFSNKYPMNMNINNYLNEYRQNLEKQMYFEKQKLSNLCKQLQREHDNEANLQQRQELLVSYEERLGVVILLFHWFVETNKYELKANVYSRNNISAQLSCKKHKNYYLTHSDAHQIQRKFDCLVLDSRNEIGKQIREWFKVVATRDIRHLKTGILLKHINSFIRSFVKSYHYIINGIVKNQNGKYNIEYVLKLHKSMNLTQFQEIIRAKQFLCKKNQTNIDYNKKRLEPIALRWTLLRLMQRCIYSRMDALKVLPALHNIIKINKPLQSPSHHSAKKDNSNDNDDNDNSNYAYRKKKRKKKHKKRKENLSGNDIEIDEQIDQNASLVSSSYSTSSDKKSNNNKTSKYDMEEEKASVLVTPDSPNKKYIAMVSLSMDESFIPQIEDDQLVLQRKISNADMDMSMNGGGDDDAGSMDDLAKSLTAATNSDILGNTYQSNIEYIELPRRGRTITNYNQNVKIDSIPLFNIYGLPRNSDYEFHLLDRHFVKQCAWMRNLSPFQLGIEEIYWCDIPPLSLHANSEILLEFEDRMDANDVGKDNNNRNDDRPQKLSVSYSDMNLYQAVTPNLQPQKRNKSHEETSITSSTSSKQKTAIWSKQSTNNDSNNYNPLMSINDEHHDTKTRKKKLKRRRKRLRGDRPVVASQSSSRGGTVYLTKGLARHKAKREGREEEKDDGKYEFYSDNEVDNANGDVKGRRFINKHNSSSPVLINNKMGDSERDFSYDFSTQPFGDCLALLQCLDQLTAPYDLNECLGLVVDVIFRTAQNYRKFNMRRQAKVQRCQLNLSLLKSTDGNDGNNSDLESKESNNNNKNRKKKKKKKKHKKNLKKRGKSVENHKKIITNDDTNKATDAAIGADVFFPLFLWVLVHCNVNNIHRSVFIMSHYNDSDAMKTKVGYNVSTLHSALDHIMKADRKMYFRQNLNRRK